MITFLSLSTILALGAISITAYSLYKYFSQELPKNPGTTEIAATPRAPEAQVALRTKLSGMQASRKRKSKGKPKALTGKQAEMAKRAKRAQSAAIRNGRR